MTACQWCKGPVGGEAACVKRPMSLRGGLRVAGPCEASLFPGATKEEVREALARLDDDPPDDPRAFLRQTGDKTLIGPGSHDRPCPCPIHNDLMPARTEPTRASVNLTARRDCSECLGTGLRAVANLDTDGRICPCVRSAGG